VSPTGVTIKPKNKTENINAEEIASILLREIFL
jgi:hypothetical protein